MFASDARRNLSAMGTKLKGRPGIDRPIRVLHCPSNVGGGPQSVANAQRELGLDSVSLVLNKNRFDFFSDEVLFDRQDGRFTQFRKIWELVFRVLREFDIVHYSSGRPMIWEPSPRASQSWKGQIRKIFLPPYRKLLPFFDSRLFASAGKGIAVTYTGSDARQRDYCLANHEITFVGHVDTYTAEMDAYKRRQIEKFTRYAHRSYALNPDLLGMLPQAQFLPFARDMRQWVPHYPEPRARPRVVHAPTHRGIKGTQFLVEATERLQREGVQFDLELIENLPHARAQRRYKEADLVVDQLFLGWYGGFAVEAMAVGKPVIAYLRESDLHVVPREMRAELPVIDATPATIYDVLKEWLTVRRNELPERGRAGRAYVERWHDARAVAKRLKADYEAILREREAEGHPAGLR